MNLGRITTAVLIASTLSACGGSNDSSNNSTPAKPSSTKVNVFSSIANEDTCKPGVDVGNCHFEKGIYVLKIDKATTNEQHQRVITQVKNMMMWAHDDVRKQFANKRTVIGIVEGEAQLNGPLGKFVLALNSQKVKGLTIEGIELIYTNQGKDETLYPTTYQKMMQVYDYYIDDNSNSAAGSELTSAYGEFKRVLKAKKSEAGAAEYLTFNECNYGNQQLGADRAVDTPSKCILSDPDNPAKPSIDDEGNDISNGKPDMVHTVKLNLNPGALLGTVYEYKVEPGKNTPAGELKGSKGAAFINSGKLGKGKATDVNWANPAFKPLDDFMNKWFFANK
ncbi:histidine ammonia-lyase [Photobacterium swingsii]|uniref:histidine ammonia-lyase n=1 Tax=Photobacterium swingsii TaxID=680026 RepID=UPI004068BB11